MPRAPRICSVLVATVLVVLVSPPDLAEAMDDKVRVWVDPESSLEAMPALSMQLRKRASLRVVLDPAEADVRVEVLEAGVVGERRVVVEGGSSEPEKKLVGVPARRASGADVVDTRRYIIAVRVSGGDRSEELRDPPRAITLREAAKRTAGEIEGWIKRHRAEILASRRAAR